MHTESELASVCVPTQERGNEEHKTVIATGYKTARSRDGPLIFHMRDGPPNVTGPPGGAGSPRFMSESDPPKTTDQPLEWLVRKKCLKKALKNSLEK
ncbi:hypothetical protein JYT79_01070 [Cardiobacterium sp. AH-315-I02]|nr:hypothetical protein [Cardiobacterium sp. AH-315-I02]